MIIGPSNGWLYAKDIFSLKQQGRFLKNARASAVELNGIGDNQRLKSFLSNEELGEFRHISLHLEDYDESKSLIEQVSLIEKIIKKRKIMYCLIHPLGIPVEYLEALAVRNVSLAIENMDKNKNSGYVLKELEKLLIDFNLKFVLDVQHAFEHDPTMEYAFDLFQMARNKIVYFHVSGETENNHHVLVCQSRNCDTIVDFLGKVFFEISVPIILEGEYAAVEELRREITFLKSELEK